MALAGRSRATRVALSWWVASSYLPDIVRWVLSFLTSDQQANLLSHSLIAVTALSICVFAARRATCDAQSIDLLLVPVCMSHWLLDVFTGCKPTLPGHVDIGFQMYQHPFWDLPVEVLLVCCGWWMARSKSALRLLLASWATPVVSAVAQVCLLAFMASATGFYVGRQAWVWRPARGVLTVMRVYVPAPPCSVHTWSP